MQPTIESIELALISWETWVRWTAIFAAAFTFCAAIGGIRLWLLQRDARPLRAAAKRADEERIATLHQLAASANERAHALELKAAEQQERAAKAELELLAVKNELKPRLLSGESRKALVQALRAASPKGVIEIFHILGDDEGAAFGEQWRSALTEAGWPPPESGAGSGADPVGLFVEVHSGAHRRSTRQPWLRRYRRQGFQSKGPRSLASPPAPCDCSSGTSRSRCRRLATKSAATPKGSGALNVQPLSREAL